MRHGLFLAFLFFGTMVVTAKVTMDAYDYVQQLEARQKW